MKLIIRSLNCLVLSLTLYTTSFAQSSSSPNFRFVIEGPNGFTAIAQVVTGINEQMQVIEYRHSDSELFSAIKIPGIVKYGSITFKRMVITNNGRFWKLVDEINANTIIKGTWIVKLINERNQTVRTWTLGQAWPTKINNTKIKSEGQQVEINSMTLSHENLTVSSP
jgi:phage tail-like protein